jgi:hypothetical protein
MKIEAQTIGGNVTTLWEQAYKQFISQNSKQHSNLQANLSQNIGKSFPESVKALKKTVKVLSTSVRATLSLASLSLNVPSFLTFTPLTRLAHCYV